MIRQTCDRCGIAENRAKLFYIRLVRKYRTECLCAECLYDTMRHHTRPNSTDRRPAPDIPLDPPRATVTEEVRKQLEG